MVDTMGWKFNMDVPWMSAAERGMYKRLREGGAVTSFKVEMCRRPECENEVPKGKLYCSKDCAEKVAAEAAATQGEQEDG